MKTNIIEEITKQIKEKGYARFDFGIFRIYKRKRGRIKYFTKDKQSKLKPYNAIFFRSSKKLKEEIKKL